MYFATPEDVDAAQLQSELAALDAEHKALMAEKATLASKKAGLDGQVKGLDNQVGAFMCMCMRSRLGLWWCRGCVWRRTDRR